MTVTAPTYFWNLKTESAVEYFGPSNSEDIPKELHYYPCVDTAHERNTALRIGVYFPYSGWKDIRQEDLPKAFRAYLLLIGVEP